MGNKFYNLSISGPLLFFNDKEGYSKNKIIIQENSFKLIHGYLNTNIISIMRVALESASLT